MIRLLLACYPKAWRRVYGEEYRALLEQTPLTFGVVWDVVVHAVKLHASAHGARLVVAAAALVSLGVSIVAHAMGLAVNVVWVPRTEAQTVAFCVLVAPWAALAVKAVRRRSWRRMART